MPESHEEMMKGAIYISGIRGITTAYIASAIEVPGRGLEPLRISPPDPKSGASANFATLAIRFRIVNFQLAIVNDGGTSSVS
jgi:hypothetical protein